MPELPTIDPLPMPPEELPAPASSAAEVRLLTKDEIFSLHTIFEANKAAMPNPATSFFVGAVEGDKISFLCVQLVLHAEPMALQPGHEHYFSSLVHLAEQTIAERIGTTIVYTFTPAGKVATMAQKAGMQMEPWVVFSKVVEGAVESVPDTDTSTEEVIQ